ncbi:unnamed protein product [Colias eurytheme]|nr:unnamed protein product [Colias eurytheme]
MKFAIPEISWHNRDPVLSVDFQPRLDLKDPLRLATGGTDSHVVIWYVSISEAGTVNLEVAADLTKHHKAVNVVRWSPNGQLLASGDDESIVFVWKQKNEDPAPAVEGEEQDKETWVIHKTLRGHMEDVLDLSWSSDSLHLASGSVDNKLLVWDVSRARHTCLVTDHKGFVQGVAWDPKGQIIASACTDRVFRTIDITTKKVNSRSSKAILPFPPEHPFHGVKVRLYHDDTLQTYYRRLHFSPDGMFIAVPGGKIEPEQGKVDTKPINAVYIYSRYSLKVPLCILPCTEPALVVRWSPLQYKLRDTGPSPPFPEPRLVLAVATKRNVLLYDTQQATPIALISNVHYTRLTDLSWSSDGLVLVASSTDGFCSLITFAENELGTVMSAGDVPATEAMDVDEPQPEVKETPEEKPAKTKSELPKIDSYIKFKTPSEKSPKKQKVETKQQKTPVKVDLLVETAMPSWSDNSSNDVIKPSKTNDVVIIEDSEDMKLVYDDTEGKSQSPKIITDSEEKKLPESPKNESKSSEKTSEGKSPKSSQGSKPSTPTSKNVDFMKQAKITDIKQPVTVKTLQSPKAPRRVSFVTLSSPKNKKSC